ncbi:NAD(P)-dependent dehydrogenase (short-subunit alcohol dehydrogenase family) [Pseudarthrobacter defluvii]|nr:NAD(P)-dependent dehydrogenase (short-subunit alcohol dehydrogenase family) [Pseudarthrobacter defluvii]
MGAHVVIIGRDAKRAQETAEELRLAGGGKVDAFVADLSSQNQVRRLADELLTLPCINGLINKAGGYWNTRHTTVGSARGDSDDEVEACIRDEVVPVTVDPHQQHHERPRSPFVAINEWMEPGDRLRQGCRLHREFRIGFRAP